MDIKWRSLSIRQRVCSGPLIAGIARFEAPLRPALHAERAVWLSAQLEAPSWGSVQGYDGCGMSAGLLHNTAVLPGGGKGPTQGKLWSLLSAMQKHEASSGAPALSALMQRIAAADWSIAVHGRLVAAGTLKPIAAAAILRELSPPNGAVPDAGAQWKRASQWAAMFHEAFAEAATYPAQIAYAADWLAADKRGEEHRMYALFAPSAPSFSAIDAASLPPEIDLAMCIYHAFSVHNPAHARSALTEVLDRVDAAEPMKVAKALVRALAVRTPRWKQKRYPRTRKALQTTAARALWPQRVIAAVAPA
jgi:hypothetical protein